MTRAKRTFALDFDGVLHRYNGWRDGFMDGPVEGALDAVHALLDKRHDVVVFTTRDKAQVETWLQQHQFPKLEVTNVKRPFYVLVDDRAVRFDGSWDGMVDQILEFEPYWVKDRG